MENRCFKQGLGFVRLLLRKIGRRDPSSGVVRNRRSVRLERFKFSDRFSRVFTDNQRPQPVNSGASHISLRFGMVFPLGDQRVIASQCFVCHQKAFIFIAGRRERRADGLRRRVQFKLTYNGIRLRMAF
ncbi:hypothetical protein ACF8FC_24460 [Leclercia adecarboxylata]